MTSNGINFNVQPGHVVLLQTAYRNALASFGMAADEVTTEGLIDQRWDRE